MHVYVIPAEEHKPIFSIFNDHQPVYEALVFQIPVIHKHVQRKVQARFRLKLWRSFFVSGY